MLYNNMTLQIISITMYVDRHYNIYRVYRICRIYITYVRP